jgi:HPt (histidine-containing phosphotransfer) domain-containing protein
MNEEQDFETQFAALREKFRDRLAVYGRHLAAERQALATAPDDDIVQRLRSLAHTLAGSAGTFGHADVSEAAADLEAATADVLGGTADSASVIAPLRRLILEVELAL